ncbi:LacI family DNA-binding transcriptional regulator [Caballeronia sp. LjRoot31]|uniref:LacI family DNA-binding transcriptional regulator n=1 Tax=Caballeronia sp. LjRoot31 TaxID=3342324 RepID=UPI003ECD1636
MTIVDVAVRAGVALGTVSRVINNKESVAPALRERVNEAARALGYVPNSVAQSMRTQSTQVVGCMVSDISNPLFSATVSAAEEVLHQHGYSMMLSNSRDRLDTEAEILTLFQRRRFDGLIITLSREEDPATLKLLADCTIPTILLERESSLPIDAVSVDHFGGTLQAMNYLIKLGHRRIGLVTVTQAALPGRQRRLAYRSAHHEAGIPIDESLLSPDVFLPDAGYQAAYRMLVSSKPPTAIVAGANQMPQVLKVVRMLKLAVPGQLSLITLGDTDVASLFEPALTAVRWELAKVGTAAAELLLARMNSTASARDPQRITIPTELVLRDSCAQR